ncbi:MAG: sugar dehydrogenase complex small subunit [Vibrio sp.]
MSKYYSKHSSSSHDKTRRNIIKGLASTSLLSFLPAFNVMADALSDDVPAAFISVSKTLTGRESLSDVLGECFYHALQATQSNFSNQVMALEKELSQLEPKNYTEKLSSQAQKTAKTILSAWYTGIVGEGPSAQVIAYRHALEFSAVDDVLTPRSYCPNKPGFWAAKPVEKHA